MRKDSVIFYAIFFIMACALSALPLCTYGEKKIIYHKKKHPKKKVIHKSARFVGEVIIDAVMLNVKLFSLDSAKIITSFIPFYLGSRMFDEDIQNNFYDSCLHKNIRQLPKSCHDIVQKGIGIPMVSLSSLALFSHNEDLRMTARMFAIGLPFVQSGKDLIKKAKGKAFLRPWHEEFSRKKRSSGGFPSGHMANATYMVTLFGMRHGLKFGIPLGIFAASVFITFLNCNRHYFSQLVAGSCLGVLYASAANKVIEKKLADRFDCALSATQYGRAAFRISYYF